jgi:hypothetical protein
MTQPPMSVERNEFLPPPLGSCFPSALCMNHSRPGNETPSDVWVEPSEVNLTPLPVADVVSRPRLGFAFLGCEEDGWDVYLGWLDVAHGDVDDGGEERYERDRE